MTVKYIIVQAGGKGSRLETLTTNKPKALVPVDNLPMIFHLFKKYPDSHFIIIADYKKDIFKKYLKAFANVKYDVIDASKKGTCSGIADSIKLVPNNEPFMLIWCDLILSNIVDMPEKIEKNYLGISKDFPCRWSYKNNKFIEEPSYQDGVAGLFLFKNKNIIKDVPEEGEFVRWLSTKNIEFERLNMFGGLEIGTMLSYFQNELNKPKCRSFNKIDFKDNLVIKYPLNDYGKKIAKDEIEWYRKVIKLGYKNIPNIHNFDPLTMDKIDGKNVFEYGFLTKGFKKAILIRIIEALKELHNLDKTIPADPNDCEDNYIVKTFNRLKQVENLVPFAKDKYITVNDKKCINIFYVKDEIVEDIRKMYPKEFHLIHGDCTFHNIMIETNGVKPVLIDPRGYFSKTKFYGDVDYDWAKLYYSLVGDYDQFNRKNFSLEIKDDSVDLEIISNNWKCLEKEFFELTGADRQKIKLLHAIIWLSLTTYAWEDYDAICGAFYKGLLELQDYYDNK